MARFLDPGLGARDERIVVDYLQRSYVGFISQLADQVSLRGVPDVVTDADDVYQRTKRPQHPTYMLRKDPKDDLLTLKDLI